ncbi:MAG: hypothetical protein K1X92_03225 [Bacteroidia bacterium]|nr:hypothetical protein [Bacteroidia bacterium]
MMKNISFLLVLVLWLICGTAFTQSDSIPVAIRDIIQIPVYELESDSNQIVLTLAYADPVIGNPEDWKKIPKGYVPYEVELVYTKYPLDYNKWVLTYGGLLKKRIENLIALDSLFKTAEIDWYLVLQTNCSSGPEAKKMFHGFVIKYRADNPPQTNASTASVPAPIPPVPYEFSSEAASKVKKPKPVQTIYGIEELEDVLRGELRLKDSTVFKVLERHPEWKNSLIVMDWTASMYEYGAQLLLWHRLNLENKISQVSYFIFFNDGNMKPYGQKKVGNTGGIYKAATNKIEDVIKIMNKTMSNGSGGELEENDLEAVLMGITKLKNFDEVILIADNSPVRDMSLLSRINRPVRVIICDPEKQWVNPEYIKIAFETGGSLHTLDDDILQLEQISEGKTKLNVGKFTMKEGKVVRIK